MANPRLLESLDNFFELLVCNGAEDNNPFSFLKVSLNSLIQDLFNSIVGSNEFTVLNSDRGC